MPKMLLCLKTASGATVASEWLDRVIQGALYLRVKLLMLQFFTGYPFGSSHKRGFFFQMAHIQIARLLVG